MLTAEQFIQEYPAMPKPEKQKVIEFLSAELDVEGLEEDINIANERLQAIQNGKEEIISAGQFFSEIETNDI